MKKIISQKLRIGALLSILISTSVQADGFSDMINLLGGIFKEAGEQSQANTQAQARQKVYPAALAKIEEPTIDTVGYGKEFEKIKALIKAEKFAQAYKIQQDKIKQEDPPVFLDSNEAGLLALDLKNPENAIEHFTAAERYLKINADKSTLEGATGTFGEIGIGTILGLGEYGDYNGAPFERILMLNYKSIAYLLNGERKAYNVTRRAIDWQNIEHKEFEKSLEIAKQELAEEGGKSSAAEAASAITSVASTTLNMLIPGVKNIFEELQKPYKDSENTALSISSAYVNPFGFYVAGIVQEFDSFEDRSLRDNARISYQKALKLNPKSKVIKQALREVKRGIRRGKRLVQVVIADGFAPEKKSLHFSIPTPGGIIPVKLPIYQPVLSKVAHIRIYSGKKRLATASPVANIEAIVLRHQLDSMPFQHTMVIASIVRSSAESVGWSQLGGLGAIFQVVREEYANPDMRSWMSLPKQLLAARFYVSKKLKSITLVSYDKNWTRLATQKVLLPKNEHSFIYARTIDTILTANVNKTLWVKAK